MTGLTALSLILPALAVGAFVGRRLRWRDRPRPERRAWRAVLLVLDAEARAVPAAALDVALALVARGAALHVLVAVRIPLTLAPDATPGDETERAAALLDGVERSAGRRGVVVVGHLRRGRSVGDLLRETAADLHPDALVLAGPPAHASGRETAGDGEALGAVVALAGGALAGRIVIALEGSASVPGTGPR